jgi:Cd2+/Zn2+-exporting ATPase
VSESAQVCALCEIHAESVFRIEGMDCHEEVTILERRLKPVRGVESLAADVMGQRLRVTYDAAKLSTSAIADAVADTGMRAWLEHEEPARVATAESRSRRWLVVASGAGTALGIVLEGVGAKPVVTTPFFALAVVTGGLYWIRRAWSSARVYSADINVLMLLAVAGAIIIGQWGEAGAVTFLFALAQMLESRSMERARLAIRALMELAPNDALVRRSGVESRIGVDQVRIGDTLIVRPGEKIPLDGRVVEGSGEVNQAPITGESLPVEKAAGDEVFAGTINGHGALAIEVSRLRRDTTLARIIALVEHAQGQRAPSQTFVERFARFYTPAVIALAVAVAVVPPLALGQPFMTWFYRALVLLVISCPCALVISTPVSIVSALASAARKGVLIKGGRHLERLGQVRSVAFDKTGTLTHGTPEVVDVLPTGGSSRQYVLRIAAALEARSAHPVGQAILRRAAIEGALAPAGDDHQALPGLGAAAMVDGLPALIGNHRLFESRGLCNPELDATLAALAEEGRTAVLVAHDNRPIGIVAVADAIRESGPAAIELLRHHGIEHIVMLTGDNTGTARQVAAQFGITEIHAELMPADKVAAVEGLRAERGLVAMVGDGVNDAPALAAADVGIAMGVAGSDAALETADIALMSDELRRIPYAIRLSRATTRNIKANIALSIGLKAIFLVLAVSGTATLWMAVMADMGASLLVIGNGLRLLRYD